MRQWTTLHKYIWLRIVQSAKAIYETVKGKIVSFVTQRAAPLKELKVEFNPVQDLHGYDSPWPAGGGKNKYDKSTAVNNANYYGPDGTITRIDGVYVSQSISLVSGTYTISFTPAGSSDYVRLNILDSNGGFIRREATLTTSPITFTMGEGDAMVQLAVNGPLLDTLQLESGSTASSYAPYSNICPISGWPGSSLHVWRSDQITALVVDHATYPTGGANRFEFTVYLYAASGCVGIKGGLLAAPGINFDPTTDELTYEEASTHTSDPNGKWFVKEYANVVGMNFSQKWAKYNWGKTSVAEGDVWYIRPFLFVTDPDGNEYKGYSSTMKFIAGQDYVNPDGGMASDDPENTFNRYEISPPTPPGTVYSGTVDVLTGVLTVTHKGFSYTSVSLYGDYQGHPIYYCDIPDYSTEAIKQANDADRRDRLMCDRFNPTTAPDPQTMGDCEIRTNGGAKINRFYFRFDDMSSLADFNAGLTTNPLVIVAELVTPITIQLTPQEVESLLGDNVMWSDANGDLTVTYRSN